MTSPQSEMEKLRAALRDSRREQRQHARKLASLVEETRQYQQDTQDHVRNILSVLRSVARSTAQYSHTIEELAERLDGRIAALARVQSALIRDPTAGVDLETLIRDQLLAFGMPHDDSISIAGEELRLRAKAASLLGLVFHELAVRSIEGGILGGQGALAIGWTISSDRETSGLLIEWAESGEDPLRTSEIADSFTGQINQAIAHDLAGSIFLDKTSSGFLCRLSIPRQWWSPTSQ